jgi:hypothetical protein
MAETVSLKPNNLQELQLKGQFDGKKMSQTIIHMEKLAEAKLTGAYLFVL